MIIITGGLGFIGSNVVHALNAKGITDIVVVDDFTDGTKFTNIADASIHDYLDKDVLKSSLERGSVFQGEIEAIVHNGACSSTTEWNGKFVMDTNYEYSKFLYHYARRENIPFIYASSASVYGNGTVFVEHERYEKPINVYAYSKTLFDRYVRQNMRRDDSQVVGLRYFNVYGPREQHKGSMASVALHLRNQLLADGVMQLFSGSAGYSAGEQRRDFIHVEDVVRVILWFLEHPAVSGIFNVGTGKSSSFNTVASAVSSFFGFGELQYIPFPDHLKKRYQSFTEADITCLRAAGFDGTFMPVEQGVQRYMEWLRKTES
ncbi:ADP-glyceromanno-heptose 6-epimerase [Desulfogranum japonicum]|uniref:ADP-glyceromanno-heptose 6-epimerase n=1 Tax=Desulfogranum japonicum TaxID=231447 RepID=UPI0004121B7F|nr:ADP-glyceromanno-heptose 6-epimerase [Desulfogranum japonicum]